MPMYLCKESQKQKNKRNHDDKTNLASHGQSPKKKRKEEEGRTYEVTIFFRQPTTVVVSAELFCVQSTVE